MIMTRSRVFFLVLSLAGGKPLCAQQMNDPYSVYGLGTVDERAPYVNSGMGYTGLALKSSIFHYGTNAASLAGLDRKYFTVDLLGSGRFAQYAGTGVSSTNANNRDFSLKGLNLATRVNRYWASGIGFRPYSSVNYQFASSREVGGTHTSLNYTFSGDGGINEYYWNNALALGQHLSLGATVSYMAGSLNQQESLTVDGNSNIVTARQDFYNGARMQSGLIYNTGLGKKWDASLGLTYTTQSALHGARTLSVTESSTAILTDEYLQTLASALPQTYGGGLALSTLDRGWTFAGDYRFSNWSALNLRGRNWSLQNSERVSAGFERSVLRSTMRDPYQQTTWQLGGFTQQSNLVVKGEAIREWGVTTGVTRSIRSLLVGLSVEGGERGTQASHLIQEHYIQVGVHLSYRDFLYGKGTRKFR